MKFDKMTALVSLVASLLVGAIGFTWNLGGQVSELVSEVKHVKESQQGSNERQQVSIDELQRIRVTMERIDARESGTTKLLQMEIRNHQRQITELKQVVEQLRKQTQESNGKK